jgi:DNA-binding NarL/FixJ family response regulator
VKAAAATHVATIRILIVEDHEVVRQGLKAIIGAQRDMTVVGETALGSEAVPLYQSTKPDLVLMDLRLRDGSGLEAIRALRALNPDCRVVVLSNYGSEEHVYRAIAAGALGYVMKDTDASQIVVALRAVHGGQRYLSNEASSRLVEHVHRSGLTQREAEVLALLARGSRNHDIGQALGIAEETVKGHVKNILGKLGARDRTEAAREAIRRGLVELD